MIVKKIKKGIKYFFKKVGYRIVRVTPTWAEIYSNPFEIQKRLVSNPNSNLVIFDIGAYRGYMALNYKKLFPNSKIYCFEPFPGSYSILNDLVGGKNGYEIFNFGLSDNSGQADFYSNIYSPTNSLLKTESLANSIWGDNLLDSKEVITVKLKTLDEVVLENKIDRIDILKIDVQGAEYKVIIGGEKTLKKGIVKIVYTEIITLPTYQGQTDLESMIRLFREMDFELFSIYNNSYSNEGRLRQIDAIFTYKEKV